VRKVGYGYSKLIKRDRVISEKPGFGAVLREGGKVNLVSS
jgi:beta-lactam-binding protein with PASTA domain